VKNPFVSNFACKIQLVPLQLGNEDAHLPLYAAVGRVAVDLRANNGEAKAASVSIGGGGGGAMLGPSELAAMRRWGCTS
jgi:hypothetical protein